MSSQVDQERLAAEVLAGFTTLDEGVPDGFADFVAERIAARPSPAAPAPDPLAAVIAKLDEILTLLRGGTPE